MRFCLLIYFFLFFIYAQTVKIGIHPAQLQYLHFRTLEDYEIPELSILGKKADELEVYIYKEKIYLKINQKIYKKINHLSWVPLENTSGVILLSYNEKKYKNPEKHKGILEFRLHEKSLQTILSVSMENYLEGVLLAEAGLGLHPEFYKVQAIISRTYALKNANKHQKEGFQLCNKVHCQGYKGYDQSYPTLSKAIEQTKSMVIIDQNKKLIDALYYANSGGETVHSEHYWEQTIPYLRSTIDDFSVDQPAYRWEKTIIKQKFYNYLLENFKIPFAFDHFLDSLGHTPQRQTKYFGDPKYGILLKTIRQDWQLRSTFFEILDTGEELLFLGKGYGHGVGLSQEGAMNMANQGYFFKEILNYYYKNTKIIKEKNLQTAYEDLEDENKTIEEMD